MARRSEVLQKTLPHETGILQSMYKQNCRRHWALDTRIDQPVIDVFYSSGRLQALLLGYWELWWVVYILIGVSW